MMLRAGVPYVDDEGLKIPRDPSSVQLNVDEVLERLQVLGLPEDAWRVATQVKVKNGKRKPLFEIQIDRRGTEYLAQTFPDLRLLMDAIKF